MRADVYLFQNGHAESREQARRLIEAGAVMLDGVAIKKPSAPIDENVPHIVTVEVPASERYVGRGGLKLEGALDTFHVDVRGFVALDIGASTGGFTDCLLSRGAAHVYAIDSGEGQLHPRLRADVRVTNIEKCNARTLTPEMIGESASLAVMDVSFISQTCILPVIPPLLN